MNEKSKNSPVKQKPEKVITAGEVTASVYLRTTNTGYKYRDFVLGRQWRNAAGKLSSGNSFFGTVAQQEQLNQAIRLAVAYIAECENGADEPTPTRAAGDTGVSN